MKTYLVLFILLIVSYKCNGGLLDGILTGAHEVHSKVHDVASTVIRGLTQGFNINGQFGFHNRQPTPPPPNQNHINGGNTDTVVVVVEEKPQQPYYRPDNNNYRPNQNGYRPYNNNNYKPGYNQNHGYNNQNENPYNQNKNPYNQNENPYNQNNYDNGNYQPNYGNPNQNNNANPNQRPFENPNHNRPYNNEQTTEFVNKVPEKNTPNYGTINSPTEENNYGQHQKPVDYNNNNNYNVQTTKKPSDDKPFLVPLNPNEYIYGGDKVEVTAPKRETNEHPKPEDNDNFEIDIRSKVQ